jgi:hypothetical protein
VYILSSLKRSQQVALLISVLFLLCLIIFGLVWRSNHIVQPARFIEKIRETQKVTVDEVHIESIRADLVAVISEQLTNQLAASNIDEPEQTMAIMLPQATEFLIKESEVVKVVNQQLKLFSNEISDWQEVSTSSIEQVYRSADMCLTIKRIKGEWLVEKLEACETNIDSKFSSSID